MKNLSGLLISISLFSIAVQGQEHKPELLKEPAGWEFEKFTLPPQFAPSIPYKGVEELRFAPGMFKKDTRTYFTYAFVAELENVTAVSRADLRSYLLKYYKGLCAATAKDRKLDIDTSQITVSVEKKMGAPANETIYDAVLNIFGIFADGAVVNLNMEIKVMVNAAAKKTYILFITSPREKKDPVWKDLHAVQKSFVIPH